jgi:GntR family transcriptional repressor for pyruvate dehydrogenase complex
MAELVAQRATPDERAEIDTVAQRFKKTMPLRAFRALDHDFHWAVARACHNPVLAEVYLKVLDGLFGSEEFDELLYARPNRGAVAQIVSESTVAHHAIAAAIVCGDVVGTVEAVERHLSQVEGRMLSKLV